MKTKLKQFLAILLCMAMILPINVLSANAAVTNRDISWYVKKNTSDLDTNVGKNWPFGYQYYDVATKTFVNMGKDLGDDGWADSDSQHAVIKPWEQLATKDKYAVTIYYAQQKGTLTVRNGMDFSGTGQVQLLQKNSEGKFVVLKDWFNAGTTWPTVKTYVKQGEKIYFLFRSTTDSAARVQFLPGVAHDDGSSDTDNLYPATSAWKTESELFGGSSTPPEPTVASKTHELSWYVTQNATGQANNYPTNWPFTYDYYDTATQTIKTMETDKGASGWADSTEAAVVTPWQQMATDTKYVAVGYYANTKGNVRIENKNNEKLSGTVGNAEIMLLQKKADGTFSVLQDWKSIPNSSQVAWENVTTYVKQGEMIYFIYRSTANTQSVVEKYTPQVIQWQGNEDTQGFYPTEWKALEVAILGSATPVVEAETVEYSWFVQQWIQPWEGSKFSFEYFDATKMAFHELEAWNCYETPAYWQDATGNIKIKGWEMVGSDVRYAAATFNADVEGVANLTKGLKITGSGADGEFMLLQKNEAGKYAVILDWTVVASGQQVAIPDTSTYVKPSETVYYMYRSTSNRDMAVGGIEPKVAYQKYALDTAKQYPTEWKDISEIFEQKQDTQGSAKEYYQITTKAGDGGKIVAMNGSNAAGKDITYQIMVKNGYQVADVLVDGVSLGVTTKFTFTELSDNHTLEVKFKKIGGNEVAWISNDEEDMFA